MKISALVIGLLFLGSMVSAQHRIYLVNGTQLLTDSTMFGILDIKYHVAAENDTLFHTLQRNEVAQIRYKNGVVYSINPMNDNNGVVNEPSTPQTYPVEFVASRKNSKEMFKKGYEEGLMYYDGKKARNTAIVLTAIPIPLLGLVGTSAVSIAPVNPHVNTVSDTKLLTNAQYVAGYKKAAHPEKVRKAWKGFLIGGAIKITGMIMLVVAVAG